MWSVDWGKLLLLGVVIVGLFVSMNLGTIEEGNAQTALLLIVGYLIGNGKTAVRRESPGPAISHTARRAGDLDDTSEE